MKGPVLTIYPNTPALRQAQRRLLEKESFLDGRFHLAMSHFARALSEQAERCGFLQDPNGRPLRLTTDLERDLAVMETAAQSAGTFPGLAGLSAAALEDVLQNLIRYISPLAHHAPAFLELLKRQPDSTRYPGLAGLYTAYRTRCHQMGIATAAEANAGALKVLGGRASWPASLRAVKGIRYTSFISLPPFVETTIQVLKQVLEEDAVEVMYSLPEHEHEFWEGGTLPYICKVLYEQEEIAEQAGDPQLDPVLREAFQSLREGLAMQDPHLSAPARSQVSFSRSVEGYGEMEDIARRIRWELDNRENPRAPCDIGLVVPGLRRSADMILHIFKRFGIPYYHRRGIPLLGCNATKTFMQVIEFLAGRKRDTFCGLLDNSLLEWNMLENAPELSDSIRRAAIGPILDNPPRETSLLRQQDRQKECKAVEQYTAAMLLLNGLRERQGSLADLLRAALDATGRKLGLNRLYDGEDSAADSLSEKTEATNRNTNAWRSLNSLAGKLAEVLGDTPAGERPWETLGHCLNRTLENASIRDPHASEAGVWLMSPRDVSGLHFKTLILAGMNAGMFPADVQPSCIFPDARLEDWKEKLLTIAPGFPASGLPDSKELRRQETLLFISSLTAVAEDLVLSCASCDDSGRELQPSILFSSMWELAGWPVLENMKTTLPPAAYDRWRLKQSSSGTDDSTFFSGQWEHAGQVAAHLRQAFHGESFMATSLLGLCRAADEARQRIALQKLTPPETSQAGSLEQHIIHAVNTEEQRRRIYSQRVLEEETETHDPGETFTGHIHPEGETKGIDLSTHVFSPSQLQTLIQCPYKFYLGKILGLQPADLNELEPSAADAGTIIHRVMEILFRFLRGEDFTDLHAKPIVQLLEEHQLIRCPCYVVQEGAAWRYTMKKPKEGASFHPVVDFNRVKNSEVRELAAKILEALLEWGIGDARRAWQLGGAGDLMVEKQRLKRYILNLTDLNFAEFKLLPKQEEENPAVKRVNVFSELSFQTKHQVDEESGMKINIRGKIDRVDFLIDDKGFVSKCLVIDYKGKGKGKQNPQKLAEGIAACTDCQLPVYSLAAREILKLSEEVNLITQYLGYSAEPKDMLNWSRKNWIELNGNPLEADKLYEITGDYYLMDCFNLCLHHALQEVESGAYSERSDNCEYCEFQNCCRYRQGVLTENHAEGAE